MLVNEERVWGQKGMEESRRTSNTVNREKVTLNEKEKKKKKPFN